MIRTKRALTAATAIGAVALLAGCAGNSAEAEAPSSDGAGGVDWSSVEPVELTVSSIFAPGATSTNLIEDWMDAVTGGTEGKVTFDYYPTGTLHPAPEALSALSSDLTDVTFVSNGFFPDQLPVSNWDDLVVQHALNDFGYPNTNIAGIGQQVIHYDGESAALDEMRQVGFVPLIPMISGPAALTCGAEFNSADDLEGRQVRVANAVAQGENEALGMTGVFTPPNEQYEALQRGVIDCAVNAVTTVLSGGLLEVSPWVTFLNTAPSSGANWVISTGAWDSLAPEIQAVMRDARYAAMERFAKDTLDQYNEIVAASKDAGGGIIDPSKLNKDVNEWWADQPDPATVAPDSVKDAAAEIERTNAIADAWWDFSVDTLGVETEHDDIIDALDLGSGVVDDWSAWSDALAEGLGTQ
ncbi:TRAP transporter substrate-binding protein [Agromyces sp. Marseille-P2726]|uniref:TRAP transporter substrate-binding protein n=1 Tax=Agromyces sp. Marseille-P2726 TaxID=2709132 RepID=UPI00156E02D1|nr:TRAP transporter substrate-binding protein DctP [Agromyces sp. Marseille-P2726]